MSYLYNIILNLTNILTISDLYFHKGSSIVFNLVSQYGANKWIWRIEQLVSQQEEWF
jgi:hypothetical protein